MQQLLVPGLDLDYAGNGFTRPSLDSGFDAALLLISHTAPETRLAAVQLLSALAKQLDPAADQTLSPSNQARVDIVFQKLCGVVSTDTWSAIRLEALAGLSGLPHASLAVRRQALSKRATYSTAATQPATVDSSLLDSATGAFVHGTEDDSEQVRLATINTMQQLGNADQQFANEAAILLTSSVSDELLPVRKAALKVLLCWAEGFQQQYMLAKQQKVSQQQQQQSGGDVDLENQQVAVMQEALQPEQQQQQQQDDLAAAVAAAAEEEEEGELVDSDPEQQQQDSGEWKQQYADAEVADLRASSRPATPAAAATAAEKPQRAGRKVSKKRRGDTPPWGPDALAAAISAMHDRDARVRELALQLALLLPPNGIQSVMGLLQGLLDCCERFGGQHLDLAMRVARLVGEQRAVYVGLAVGKIVKLFMQVADSAAAVQAARVDHARVFQTDVVSKNPGLQILQEVLCAAAAVRPQLAQVMLQQLEQSGLQQQEAQQALALRLRNVQQTAA